MRLVIDSNIIVGSPDSIEAFHSECYPVFKIYNRNYLRRGK